MTATAPPDILTPGHAPEPPRTRPKESSRTWPWRDRLGLYACWACGLALCLVMGGILAYMAVRGIQYLRPNLFLESPTAELNQKESGGFKDPLIGTVLITTVGILIAFPIGVATAVWLNEYRRPSWLARAVESGVEVVAGTPTVVLAIFGLIVFQNHIFAFLSFTAQGNAVFGRSFLTAGTMMSLIALPLVVTATRAGLQQIPQHVREASYALGKTKYATIRHVLLPSCRPSIATGTVLGMGRIIGDTAIVVILLGATLQLQGVGDAPLVNTLRGTGSTLTTYVYNNSPAGEGQSPEKAYAAAFVLLLIVVLLNLIVDRITNREARRMDPLMPPPIKRIAPGSEPRVVAPPPGMPGNGAVADAPAGGFSAANKLRRRSQTTVPTTERMAAADLSIAYGDKIAVNHVSLPVRQGEVLALIGPSGCGKTTLLRSLNRLTELTPTAKRFGTITLDGENIDRLEVTSLRRRVSMVFQQPNPFPMSVFDNIAYALREGGGKKPKKSALTPMVREALERAGLWSEVADNLGHQALRLSGGQQQRLCIARSLAASPEVLLLDEPCSALDPISTEVIEELIVRLREQVAIVIVTHNLQQAYRVADHVAFMYLGELVEYGPVEQVFQRPVAERTREYVGGAFG